MDVNTDEAYKSFLPGNREDDSSLIVRFFMMPKVMGFKSQQAGHEVTEPREFIEIVVKGQLQNIPTREVRPEDIKKYPNAYAAFKANQPAPLDGTPIEQLPNLNASQIYSLKALGIRSIEDLGGLSDAGLQNVGIGARDLQKRAKAYLEKSTVAAADLKLENEAMKARMLQMEETMAKLLQATEMPAVTPITGTIKLKKI